MPPCAQEQWQHSAFRPEKLANRNEGFEDKRKEKREERGRRGGGESRSREKTREEEGGGIRKGEDKREGRKEERRKRRNESRESHVIGIKESKREAKESEFVDDSNGEPYHPTLQVNKLRGSSMKS